jgi:hypothetical protein
MSERTIISVIPLSPETAERVDHLRQKLPLLPSRSTMLIWLVETALDQLALRADEIRREKAAVTPSCALPGQQQEPLCPRLNRRHTIRKGPDNGMV